MSWSDLPAEFVGAIADRLTEHADLARFRSVCPSWRSASEAHAARRRVPLLLLTSPMLRVGCPAWLLTNDRLGDMPIPDERRRSFLFASPHGWALGVGTDLSATLVHAFTGAWSDLPTLPPSFRGGGGDDDDTLRDMVWDWSPHAVVVSPGKDAFFCRLGGDASWSPIECSQIDAVDSIAYSDGAFYLFDGATLKTAAVDVATFGNVAVIEPPPLEMKLPLSRWWRSAEAKLAVSSDELLLLVRTQLLVHKGYLGNGKFFKAFRADRAGGARSPRCWSEVTDIGDRAVFVDHLRAFCVEASDANGLRKNCMYVASSYTVVDDDYGMEVYGRYSAGVLDLADLTTTDLEYGSLNRFQCSRFWQWLSWSMPNLL